VFDCIYNFPQSIFSFQSNESNNESFSMESLNQALSEFELSDEL
ncbi:uncharacterized protein METZ01_LOCUS350380, partial [marine metagenome]